MGYKYTYLLSYTGRTDGFAFNPRYSTHDCILITEPPGGSIQYKSVCPYEGVSVRAGDQTHEHTLLP